MLFPAPVPGGSIIHHSVQLFLLLTLCIAAHIATWRVYLFWYILLFESHELLNEFLEFSSKFMLFFIFAIYAKCSICAACPSSCVTLPQYWTYSEALAHLFECKFCAGFISHFKIWWIHGENKNEKFHTAHAYSKCGHFGSTICRSHTIHWLAAQHLITFIMKIHTLVLVHNGPTVQFIEHGGHYVRGCHVESAVWFSV